MKLTANNYYTTKNRYISNSKINDFVKSKRLFYEKHVLGTRVKEETPALTVGKAVDLWLTGSRQQFERNYIRVDRRSKEEDGPIQLTGAQYDEIVGICEAVEKTSAFKEFKKGKSQVILQKDMKLGMFEGVCGILDKLKIDKDGETAIIDDLKTSRTIDYVKYYYHALEYSYFRQQAVYQLLVEWNFGIKNIVSRHLVVEKDPDKIYKVATFVLDQSIIDKEKQVVMDTLQVIAKEKKFEDPDVSFKDAINLTNPRVSAVEVMTDEEWEGV